MFSKILIASIIPLLLLIIISDQYRIKCYQRELELAKQIITNDNIIVGND